MKMVLHHGLQIDWVDMHLTKSNHKGPKLRIQNLFWIFSDASSTWSAIGPHVEGRVASSSVDMNRACAMCGRERGRPKVLSSPVCRLAFVPLSSSLVRVSLLPPLPTRADQKSLLARVLNECSPRGMNRDAHVLLFSPSFLSLIPPFYLTQVDPNLVFTLATRYVNLHAWGKLHSNLYLTIY